MDITFPGGMAVEASFDRFTIRTDQPVAFGGGHSAPAPFELFLASIGTCAGFYALRFCQQRDLSMEGLRLTLEVDRDEQQRLRKIRLILHLPAGFPEKYARTIIRVVNQCSVKQAILDPPEFEVVTRG
jgi:putative redox protein